MNYTGKKILILAGAEIHNKVVETAKNMGIYTVVTDYLQNSPAKMIADESLQYDIFDVENLVKWSKKNAVDGVVAYCCDPTQRPAQEIAERLGLNTFGTKEQVEVLTDKEKFKIFCIENSVDVIPAYSLTDIESGKIEYPLLVKPADSRGSRGITICNTKKEILEALSLAQEESKSGKVIIEKYMGGHQDLTISYMVIDGNPMLISIGDRYSGLKSDNLDRQLVCTIQPSRYADMYMSKVNDRVVQMIKNLGIKNAPVFMQGFVDGDTVRMYDPGIRFPGNEYARIFKKATGLDPVKSIISYCVGEKLLDYNGMYNGSYNLNGKCAIQYMVNAGKGTIAKFEGLDEIARHKDVVDIQQKHFAGDVIHPTGDVRHRVGEISILTERNAQEMIRVIDFIQSKISIVDTNGENMIISPFDCGIITHNYFGGFFRNEK